MASKFNHLRLASAALLAAAGVAFLCYDLAKKHPSTRSAVFLAPHDDAPRSVATPMAETASRREPTPSGGDVTRAPLEAAPGERTEADILKITDGLNFVVQRPDGTPAPFVRFHLFQQEKQSSAKVEHVFVGDRGGKATCPEAYSRQRAQVVAVADGFGSTGLVAIDSHRANNEPIQLTILPFAFIRGSVTDPDARPAAFVPVEAEVLGSNLGAATPRQPAGSITDSEGQFEIQLDGVGGDYQVRAGSRGSDFVVRRVLLGLGESSELVLRLASSRIVRGRVVEPTGEDAPGAGIVIGHFTGEEAAEDSWQHLTTLTADGSGDFEWEATESGLVSMFAVSDDFSSSSEVRLDLASGSWAPFTVLRLRAPSTIAGQLTWSSGQPIANTEIAAEPISAADSPAARHRTVALLGLPRGRTDHAGRFQVGPASPGASYSLSVTPLLDKPECIARSSPVEAGFQSVDWVVDPSSYCGVSVRAQVVLEDTDGPLTDLFVDLHRKRHGAWELFSHRSFTAADGAFEMKGLIPNVEYALTVANAPGYMPVVWGPFRTEGSGVGLSLVMLRPRTIRATLRNSATLRVAGTHVKCTASDDHPGRTGFLAYPVDRQGCWTMYLWPGDYDIELVTSEMKIDLGRFSVAREPLEQFIDVAVGQ